MTEQSKLQSLYAALRVEAGFIKYHDLTISSPICTVLQAFRLPERATPVGNRYRGAQQYLQAGDCFVTQRDYPNRK